MVGMVLLILAEVVLRGAFNSTTEHSDELVGYLLVGLSFLSLALCQSRGAFHRVEMVQMRLGPRGQAISALVFDLLSFGYIALTGWYFLMFVMSSYRREAMASTALGTPLWIPETAMIVGAVMLLIVLGKAVVHDVRKIAS
jgi:TRAP-type C4-dicarboxylate transport system permease small subunit